MGEAPGWYTDSEGQEWFWDGHALRDKPRATTSSPAVPWTAPLPPKSPTNWKGLGIVVGAALAVLLVGIASAIIDPSHSEDYRSSVVDTCQGAVKKGLKDPDSARFDGWTATEVSTSGAEGDRHFSASGTVNAKNGFGGYTGGQPYTCDATVSNEGDIHASARP